MKKTYLILDENNKGVVILTTTSSALVVPKALDISGEPEELQVEVKNNPRLFGLVDNKLKKIVE